MKYNEKNPPISCILKSSTCFKQTRKMQPKGILVHSTGANNPWLKRYVQPDGLNDNEAYLMTILGYNSNHNDWNHIDRQAGVNAFIGKLANGNVATVQTLPWIYRPWGCGSGPSGSCNDNWIQIEVCEDNLTDFNYFKAAYAELIELIAFLCKHFNIDPKGQVNYKGLSIPTLLCHADSYRLGVGSNHGDIYHWFPKFNKDMQTIRDDVYQKLKEEEEEVTQEQFNIMMNEYLKQQRALEPENWSAEARAWCEETGIIKGDTQGNKQYKKLVTKQDIAQMLYNFSKTL